MRSIKVTGGHHWHFLVWDSCLNATNQIQNQFVGFCKAFDTVQHSRLFKKLLGQGLPPIIVRFLLASYRDQQANVKWNNELSHYFDIKNGVKQGAILSSILYFVYTNGLFEKLRRLKSGCHVGHSYVGVIGYADDLLLMSPSIDGLQEMSRVCEYYTENHTLKFSTNTD